MPRKNPASNPEAGPKAKPPAKAAPKAPPASGKPKPKAQKPDPAPAGTMPGNNGGTLKRGGVNPGAGRPRNELRDLAALGFERVCDILIARVQKEGDKMRTDDLTKIGQMFIKGGGIEKVEAESSGGIEIRVVRTNLTRKMADDRPGSTPEGDGVAAG